MTSGIPQGTIVGPISFLVFINDIVNGLSSSCKLYADDCVLYRVIKGDDDCDILQSDINKVFTWSQQWRLNLNVEKCHLMHVSRKQACNRHAYYMDGNKLEDTVCEKYLGVSIVNTLSWKKKVDVVKTDCYQKLGVIRRNFFQM